MRETAAVASFLNDPLRADLSGLSPVDIRRLALIISNASTHSDPGSIIAHTDRELARTIERFSETLAALPPRQLVALASGLPTEIGASLFIMLRSRFDEVSAFLHSDSAEYFGIPSPRGYTIPPDVSIAAPRPGTVPLVVRPEALHVPIELYVESQAWERVMRGRAPAPENPNLIRDIFRQYFAGAPVPSSSEGSSPLHRMCSSRVAGPGMIAIMNSIGDGQGAEAAEFFRTVIRGAMTDEQWQGCLRIMPSDFARDLGSSP